MTNQINNQSIPSTDVIQLTLTLKMTTAQVVETSVTVNNNSPIQDYVHPDDQTQPTFIYSLFPWWRRFFNKTENLPRTQTFLSLSMKICAQRKVGRRKRVSLLSPSHGFLGFVTSHSRFALDSAWKTNSAWGGGRQKVFFKKSISVTKSFIFKLFLRGACFGKSVFILMMIYFRYLNPLKNLKLLCDWHI